MFFELSFNSTNNFSSIFGNVMKFEKGHGRGQKRGNEIGF